MYCSGCRLELRCSLQAVVSELLERLRSTSTTNTDSEIYDVVLCLVAGVLKRSDCDFRKL